MVDNGARGLKGGEGRGLWFQSSPLFCQFLCVYLYLYQISSQYILQPKDWFHKVSLFCKSSQKGGWRCFCKSLFGSNVCL